MESRTEPAMIVLYLLLTNFLFSGIFIAQAQRATREVNGIVGGTALLSVMGPQDHHVVDEVRWKYGSVFPARVRLGDFKGRIFEPYNGSYANYSQLLQRLEMHNETTLKIRNLTNGDGGVYKADVQFKDGMANEVEIQLKLYDPVPEPHIEEKSRTNTSDGCNVTLECQPSNASNGRDLSITWLQENLSERSHMRISNGSLLSVSLKSSTDSRYICSISNSADTKNRSISLACLGDSDRNHHVVMYLSIPIVTVISFLFCGAYFCWKKKKKKKKRKDKGSTTDDKGRYCPASHEEITEYSSSTRRSPDGADEVNSQLEDEETTTKGNQMEHSTQQTPIYPGHAFLEVI